METSMQNKPLTILANENQKGLINASAFTFANEKAPRKLKTKMETKGLSIYYNKTLAVEDFSLSIP
ncbi:hypothetical protein EG834_12990, partial [bacterium]|nr:hypothetical protein [bacterium]